MVANHRMGAGTCLPCWFGCFSPSSCLVPSGSGARSRSGWGASCNFIRRKTGSLKQQARQIAGLCYWNGLWQSVRQRPPDCSALPSWREPGRGGDQGIILVAPQGQAVAPDTAGIERLDIALAGVAHQGGPVAEHQNGVIYVMLALLEPGRSPGVDSLGPFLHLKSSRPSK